MSGPSAPAANPATANDKATITPAAAVGVEAKGAVAPSVEQKVLLPEGPQQKVPTPESSKQKVPAPESSKEKVPAPESSRPKISARDVNQDELGCKIIYVPANPDEIEVDIVAVHGLAADPRWTWVYTDRPANGPKREINWVDDSDMLRVSVPKARIMRYGYDSVWYGAGAVKQRLASIANQLLRDLVYTREGCEERPIIFVGHCFGGLVMQKAYLLAKSHDVDYPGIWKSTTGLLFIGTPHQGTGAALHSQGSIYQAIAADNLPTEEGILRTLEGGNETLVDVVREFTRLAGLQPPPVNIYCFYEQKSTIVGKIVRDDSIKEYVVDEASGALHGHASEGLPLDHFNLNKYRGPNDINYIRVQREIVSMVKKSKAVLESRNPGVQKAAAAFVGPAAGPAQAIQRGNSAALSRLPFSKDPIFAPRNNIINRIGEKFAKTLRVVLCGTAGNGKTHVAVEYAHQYSKDFPGARVLWVNARTARQFERSYAVITEDLRIQNRRGNILTAVQRHLHQEANGHWLMVLDGVDDESLLRPTVASGKDKGKKSTSGSLLDYIPESMSGRVLITTRKMSLASSLVNQKSDYVIDVSALSDDDAVFLLYGAVTKDATKKQAAVELARVLNQSPLAVSIAGAYIQAQGPSFTVRNYLDLLSQGTPKLGGESPKSEKEGAELAAERVFNASYKLLKEKDAEAARLLLVIGSFDLQGLRHFFLAKGTDARAQFMQHVSLLVSYGVLKQSDDRTSVSMTALVQRCAQRLVGQSDDPTWAAERALALVTAAFPAAESEEFETCEILYPCASAILEVQPKTTAGKTDLATLLFKLGDYNRDVGRLEAAIQYLKDCVKIREDHPDKNQDLVKQTKKVLDDVRDEQRRTESAPEVAMASGPGESKSSSAAWGRIVGKVQSGGQALSEAMTQEEYQEVGARIRAELEECEKTLGKDHEETLRKADSLAVALHKRDPKGESIAIRQRVLEWCVAKYGPRSLDTIRQTYNLALAYDVQGQYDKAAELYRAAFSGAENLLAPGSPELLRILSSMALVYISQGRTSEAEEAFRVVLAGQQEKLGPDHPETLATRQNAALAAQVLGKFDLVEKDLTHVLRAQERFLGAEHEATLRTACSLALNFRLQGHHAKAEELYKLVLDSQQKVLGSDHPDTLMTRLMLGELLQEMGKLPQARVEYKTAFEGRKKLCGEKHPDTVYVMRRLEAIG
ncbi:hypothetical protein DRE_06795 [Drechslerella stenobrocha 248]|uniref:NB-ARC domain-containing protein n=1 Tax=Drechslerella stenobrocha 248 TaxID=1043628 RepID=W7HWH5_9PEZI|nr:hypothetical protein DRE_06795 [Drechslerella stenobrocha 248]